MYPGEDKPFVAGPVLLTDHWSRATCHYKAKISILLNQDSYVQDMLCLFRKVYFMYLFFLLPDQVATHKGVCVCAQMD